MNARPFVKWAGGKTRSVDMLKEFLPTKINRYYEPMVGGGALFFALANEHRFHRALLNDVNEELILGYYAVKHDVEKLIRALARMKVGKRAFLAQRSRRTRRMTPVSNAARFIYLNKTCFNGLYRVNKKGQFNVPFGSYKKPIVCDRENLRACSKALSNVALESRDFEVVTRDAGSGDAVYFDPPYIPLSKTSDFTAYTAGGFTMKDHERLASVFAYLARKGVAVALTNSDTDATRDLYNEFDIHTFHAARAINSDGAKRGKVSEVLVTANCRQAAKSA
jgi:DNA adenine methylase